MEIFNLKCDSCFPVLSAALEKGNNYDSPICTCDHFLQLKLVEISQDQMVQKRKDEEDNQVVAWASKKMAAGTATLPCPTIVSTSSSRRRKGKDSRRPEFKSNSYPHGF